MSRAAKYYGSQRSLLRMLRHAPRQLGELVAAGSQPPLSGNPFEWLDAGLRLRLPERREPFSLEWRGVDFLAEDAPGTVAAYRSFWPQTGNVPSWDAVGVRAAAGGREWLLVEAKAHIGELRQSCAAKPRAEGGSRELIEERLDEVKAALKARVSHSWLEPYYQFANRIAALWFLHEHGVEARLVHICMVGDEHFADVARSTADWGRALAAMDEWAGRPFDHPVEARLHSLVVSLGELEAGASAE